jgi:putative restriction endonuclease
MNQRESEVLRKIERLSTWRRGSERAPHKPLLLLLAVSRVVRGEGRFVEFGEIEEPLGRLLLQYGPPRRSVHPEYPFWRLQSDGVWQVKDTAALKRRKSNSDPLKSELIRYKVKAGFSAEIFNDFQKDTEFRDRVVRMLLEAHFPESLHDDILNDLGLSMSSARQRKRGGAFCNEVLKAYGYCCAVCGYDVRVGRAVLGLEAAHIKWFQAGGPDAVANGVALCSIHHKALDYGAIGLTREHMVVLSCDLHGHGVPVWFEPYHGKKLRVPPRAEWMPDVNYISWHTAEVFRNPARDL